MSITVSCPSCEKSFPVDPRKIPEGGVNARCNACSTVFFIDKPEEPEAVAVDSLQPEPEPSPPSGERVSASNATTPDPEVAAPSPEVAPPPERSATIPPEPPRTEVTPTEPTATPEPGPTGGTGATTPTAEREEAAEEIENQTGEAPEALPEPEAKPQGFQFGRRDPHEKARRLARVLVSDMIMYNPDRHTKALENGTLKEDFEEEIEKSWEEYTEQVGEEVATNTDYFNDALNDILAKGAEIFDEDR